jgi:hypothetical protein
MNPYPSYPVIENLLHLAPGLALQFLLAGVLLWLFIPKTDKIPYLRILLIALVFSLLNLLIEWSLREYLLEGTLVLQWTLFVLLATRFLSIPLPRAALTLFCFFSLMLGAGLLEARLSPAELSEEERLLIEGFEAVKIPSPSGAETVSPGVLQMRMGILDQRILSAREVALRRLYASTEPESGPDPQPDTIEVPIVVTEEEPEIIPPAVQTPSTVTGAEFEALFVRTSSPVEPVEGPASADPETEVTIGNYDIETDLSDPEPVRSRRNQHEGFNAEQLADAVKVRNRSTDRRYAPPRFEIGAVGIGTRGRFAIVDGEMVKEGGIIRTHEDLPRGWKLHRIESSQLFWQPLR